MVVFQVLIFFTLFYLLYCSLAVMYLFLLTFYFHRLWYLTFFCFVTGGKKAKIADLTTLQAALLHDVIEDTETTAQEIEDQFGATVRSIVQEVTDNKGLTTGIQFFVILFFFSVSVLFVRSPSSSQRCYYYCCGLSFATTSDHYHDHKHWRCCKKKRKKKVVARVWCMRHETNRFRFIVVVSIEWCVFFTNKANAFLIVLQSNERDTKLNTRLTCQTPPKYARFHIFSLSFFIFSYFFLKYVIYYVIVYHLYNMYIIYYRSLK